MIIQYIRNLFSKTDKDQIPVTDKDPLSVHQRYLKEKLPFVIRGGAKNLKAYDIWTDEYLLNKIGDNPVEVETSSNGIFNPDSPTADSDLIDMTVKTYLNFRGSYAIYATVTDVSACAALWLRSAEYVRGSR